MGVTLSLAAFLPPPFPTSAFVTGAGVTRNPFVAFVLSFGVGRVCRFALLVYLFGEIPKTVNTAQPFLRVEPTLL
ncbi:MAG: hypothetical protein WBV55_23305 [Candidatus Sulfotelmatobacter sp.]